VIWTHDHADQCHGIDDLRPFALRQGQIESWSDERTYGVLSRRFGYCFHAEGNGFYNPIYRHTVISGPFLAAALPVPEAEQAKAIKSKILICHGARDSFIPEETIHKVRDAFEEAGVDYEMVYYSGAVHSFTVPDAGKAGLPGLAYNAEADHRSWRSMRRLFDEVFKPAN